MAVVPNIESMDIFEAYLNARKSKRLDPGTLVNKRLVYKHFIEWTNQHGIDPVAATVWDIDAYFGEKVDQFQPNTMREHVVQLRSVYKFCVDRQLIEVNPVQVDPPRIPQRIPRTLDTRLLRQLRDTADRAYRTEMQHTGHGRPHDPGRWARMFYLLAYTGCRRTEIRQLRWEDVNTVRMELRVVGKGDKERIVPLHPVLRDKLHQYSWNRPLDGYILSGWKHSKQASDGTLQNWMTDLRPPGTEVTFHDFRRTVASSLGDNGVDPGVIDRMLGWESRSIQDRYYRNRKFGTLQDAILRLYADDPID